MSARVAALAAVFASVLACTPKDATPAGPPPKDVIAALYAPYVAVHGLDAVGDKMPPGLRRADLSRKLTRVKDTQDLAFADCPIGPLPINFDVVIDAQDWDVSDVVLTPTEKGDKAMVVAKFKNFGTDQQVTWSLVREDGQWKVDDARTDVWDLQTLASMPFHGGTPEECATAKAALKTP